MISPVVREALEKNRERYNRLFALARHGHRRVDARGWSELLHGRILPLVEAARLVDREAVPAVLDALYETGLQLLSQGILGPAGRSPLVDEAWRELLVRLSRWLVRAPRELVAAVTNAVWNLSAEREALARSWMDEILRLSPGCPDVESLLDLGRVLAWRLGMAHWREGALRAWRRLPDDLARAALLPEKAVHLPPRDELIRRLESDRWWLPGADDAVRIRFVGRVGGFRGFGGAFLTPPALMVGPTGLVATDDDCAWTVHCDVFGALLRRLGPDLPGGSESGDGAFSLKGKTLRHGELVLTHDPLPAAARLVDVNGLAAVVSKESHWIWLFARSGRPS